MTYLVILRRFRELRQPDERAGGDPGHERLPDRHEAAQGAAEEAQGRQQALLNQESGGRRKEGPGRLDVKVSVADI